MTHGRRKHERTPAKNGDIQHPEYKCLDISESGLKFEFSKEVRIGKTFNVTLTVLDKPIELSVSVVWCKKAASVYEDGFHFGVTFLNIRLVDQLQLRKLIDSRAEKTDVKKV